MSVPTVIGDTIFAPDGWDPYCEDPGTRWLLHWLLLAPKSMLPVWWSAFHEFNAVEFDDEQLTAFTLDGVSAVSRWHQPMASSISKDVSILLRTYAPTRGGPQRAAVDDLLDSPFRDLGLFRCVDPGARVFRFVIGSKATLPPAIVAFAALDFLARTDVSARTVTVSRLATEPGGPGRAFRLTEGDLSDCLEQAAVASAGIRIARPAGATQLGFDGPPDGVATAILASHYDAEPTRVIAGAAGAAPVSGPQRLAFDASAATPPQGFGADEPPEDVLERLEWFQKRENAGVLR